MTLSWLGAGTIHRCYTTKPVRIMTREWGGGTRPYNTQDMGYVMHREGRLMACVYGTINPDTPGKWFDNIDEAKAYVEEQVLLGLTLNKLQR